MIDLKQPEVAFAVDAARISGILAKKIQAELITPALVKGDKSPVTVADFAVQAVVGSLIERALPGDALVGEEDASDLRTDEGAATLDAVVKFTSDTIAYATHNTILEHVDRGGGKPASRFWTLDPIDGTKGFLRKEQYAIALALIENGVVTLGVLGCPNMTDGFKTDPDGPGSIVLAKRGEGVYTTPMAEEGEWTKLTVSEIADGKDARVLRSVEAAHTNLSQIDIVLQHLNNEAEPVRLDSQAKYSVLASGTGDLLLRLLSPKQPDYQEKIWDQAAGSIVVEEAGGRVTDLSGAPLDFSQGTTLAKNRGVVASNGLVHDAALAALKAADAI